MIRCKRCTSRLWDDDDGSLYCANCGWEVGSDVDDDDKVAEAKAVHPSNPLDDEPEGEVTYFFAGSAEATGEAHA